MVGVETYLGNMQGNLISLLRYDNWLYSKHVLARFEYETI